MKPRPVRRYDHARRIRDAAALRRQAEAYDERQAEREQKAANLPVKRDGSE